MLVTILFTNVMLFRQYRLANRSVSHRLQEHAELVRPDELQTRLETMRRFPGVPELVAHELGQARRLLSEIRAEEQVRASIESFALSPRDEALYRQAADSVRALISRKRAEF